MEDKLKNFQEDIDELERQRDEVHAELTEETERIRKLNPELDQNEEALKEEKRKIVAEAKPLRQEARRLSDVFLGRWKNRARIRELEYQIENLQREIDDLTVKINDVRKIWQEKKEEWRREKVTAEQRWNEITLRIAEIRHEYIYNKTNQETIVLEEGIRRFAEELMDGTNVKAEDYSDEVVKIYFAEFSRLLERKKTLESSLDVLAKLIGKLIGIDRGIKRLRKSVDALKDEQDRYASLRQLQIETPQTISDLEKLLETLEAIPRKSLEEPEAARNILGPFLDEEKGQLSDENIKEFFDSVGDNLQAAVQTYWR
jgi:cell division septum initiation protein DivIVA